VIWVLSTTGNASDYATITPRPIRVDRASVSYPRRIKHFG